MKLYFFNLLIGLDQFVNVVLAGAPDETISGRSWRHRDHWAGALAVKFIDFLFSRIEKDHCRLSFENDEHKQEVWG